MKRLHDAANDPTYSSPRVRRADVQAVVRLVDAQAARLAAVTPVVEAAERLAADAVAYDRGAITSDVWESARRTGVGRIIAAVQARGAVGAGEP